MATEREELRLTVSLVDNVSAGLNKIKGEFKDLTEGSGKGHAERFKRENTEAIAILKRMGGEATEAYKAFGMMRLGALGAAGGVALLGYAVAKQVKEWGELAEKVRSVNQIARTFGIDPAALRNIQEQLEVAGVSAERSIGMVTRFMNKMGEMQRDPRARHDILQGVVHDDEAVKEMERRIDQINNAKTAIEKLNLAQELFANVERNARKQINPRTGQPRSAEDAAGIRLELQQQLGYDPALGFAGKLKELSAEQARWDKERNDSLEAYATTLGRIAHQWDEISKLLSSPIFSENSPLVKGAKAVETLLTNAKDMLEYVKRGGFDAVLHPNDPEARQRAIDAMKELQHERQERMTPEERAKEHEDEEKAKKQEELWRERRGRDPRKRSDLGGQQYASLGTMNDASGTTPVSEWTADPQVLTTADRTKYMKENTTELKRLNDLLMGNVATGGPGGVGGFGFLNGGGGGGGGGGGLAGRLGYGGANGINTGAGGAARAAGRAAGADTSDAPTSASLETLRKDIGKQLEDPETRRLLMASTAAEVGGQGKNAELAYMESVANRSIAEKRPLRDVLMDPKYYPGATKSKLGRSFSEGQQAGYNESITKLLGGSNVSDLSTGNESGGVHSGGAEVTYNPRTGERFVAETWTTGWRARQQAAMRGEAPGTTGPAAAGGSDMEFLRARGGHDARDSNQPGGLSPEMAARVAAAGRAYEAATGKRANYGEMFRDRARQAKYYQEYISGGGGLAAPPGRSRHEQGTATDVPRGGFRDWLASGAAGHYGLEFLSGSAYQRDPVHVQMNRDYHGASFAGRNQPSAAADGGSSPVSRDQIERARSILNRNQNMKVEGSGKLSVDVNAPEGTRVGAQGKGLFKTVEINRQTQMEPAKRGPSQDANEDD